MHSYKNLKLSITCTFFFNHVRTWEHFLTPICAHILILPLFYSFLTYNLDIIIIIIVSCSQCLFSYLYIYQLLCSHFSCLSGISISDHSFHLKYIPYISLVEVWKNSCFTWKFLYFVSILEIQFHQIHNSNITPHSILHLSKPLCPRPFIQIYFFF